MIVQVEVGDIATMRKAHPCGSKAWRVTRIGVDIGLQCLKCEHKIMLPRSKFNKSVAAITAAN